MYHRSKEKPGYLGFFVSVENLFINMFINTKISINTLLTSPKYFSYTFVTLLLQKKYSSFCKNQT